MTRARGQWSSGCGGRQLAEKVAKAGVESIGIGRGHAMAGPFYPFVAKEVGGQERGHVVRVFHRADRVLSPGEHQDWAVNRGQDWPKVDPKALVDHEVEEDLDVGAQDRVVGDEVEWPGKG